MSNQPAADVCDLTSQMSFDHHTAHHTSATATHAATVDGDECYLKRTFDPQDDSETIRLSTTGLVNGTARLDTTRDLPAVDDASSCDNIPGNPYSFVGLVTMVHYQPSPADQLSTLACSDSPSSRNF